MQNLFGNAATIKAQGKIFRPMGDGKTGMSDARDVGAVIAEVLLGSGHENREEGADNRGGIRRSAFMNRFDFGHPKAQTRGLR